MASEKLNEAMQRFLGERRFAVLATVNRDGTPQQTVMWYDYRGDHVMMNTLAGRLKDSNLLRDPRVSVCVEDEYRYVTIRGTVTIDDDPRQSQEDIFFLARRYNPDFKEGDYASFATQQRKTLRISIDMVDAHGFDD